MTITTYSEKHCNKSTRGYTTLYDAILAHYGIDNDITEIGIGLGESHVKWANIMTGNTIGIDVSGPVVTEMADEQQVKNYIMLQNYLTSLDQSIIDKLKFTFNTDAFASDTAKNIADIYGKQRIVINDSKHRPFIWQDFQNTWFDQLADDGVLIQEDFGRDIDNDNAVEIPNFDSINSAIEQGWHVYDFTDNKKIDAITSTADIYGPGGTAESSKTNYIGVKFKNPNMISILKSLENRLYKSTKA